MVNIKQQIVDKHIRDRVTFKGINQRRTLTVHQTGNPRVGANAQMHANLQSNGNTRAASWMIQSDDTEIIQSFPFTAQTWHAGDGRGPGNLHSISWEICINADADYMKALQLAAKGIAQVLTDHKLDVSDLRQHWDWSRKNCPEQIRRAQAGVDWDTFKAMVRAEILGAKQPKPKPEVKPQPVKETGYTGNSVVEYLNSLKQNSSFRARSALAEQKGIQNYRGTAQQNLQLLAMLRAEGNPQAQRPIGQNDRVQVNANARTYVTGQPIPQWVKANTYTVQQTRTENGERQVLLREIRSWVKETDVKIV